jgi:general secretion pathway protein C
VSRLVALILKLFVISVVIFTGVSLFYKVVLFRLNEHMVQPPVKVITRTVKAQKVPFLSESRAGINSNKGVSAVSKIPYKTAEKEEIDSPHPELNKLALRGTVNSGQENALAVIEDKEIRSQGLYRIGDFIKGGVIKQILKQKAIIRFGERDEILTMEGSGPSDIQSKFAENEFDKEHIDVTVAHEDLEKAFENVKDIMSQMLLRPVILDGESRGLQLVGVRQGSMFEKYGLKNGDIIQEINGTAIKNPGRLAALYNGLKSVPLDISFTEIGSGIENILLGVDRGAGGIAKEVSDVYRKIESRDKFSMKLTRKGKRQTINYRIR